MVPAVIRSTIRDRITRSNCLFCRQLARKSPECCDRQLGYSWDEIVDSHGNVWLPDQIYETGKYGYIGNSQLRRPQQVLPNVAIENTKNDEIFRTGRMQLTHYRVALPSGEYDVVLHFANLVDGKLWHPTIDVKVEGEMVVNALDARQMGRLSATTRRCESVRVTDGVLDIDLTQSEIALCGLQIVRSGEHNTISKLE